MDRDREGAVGVIERCRRSGLAVSDGLGSDLVCDVAAVHHANLGAVDALARLALTARRHGLGLQVERSPRALVELLDLCGLAGLLARLRAGADADGSVETGR